MDFSQKPFEPVPAAGVGAALLPSVVMETVGEIFSDIGNGGLEAAQITGRPGGQKQPAVAAPIAAHKERMSTFVEISCSKPVRPDAAATTRTPIGLDPGKSSTQLKDVLDGGFDEKYQ
jgi:hypothetical protein